MTDSEKLGLIGCWKFDDESGRIVHDSSGNENHGAIFPDEGRFETWGTGDFANTLSLSGKDGNHVSIAASDSLNKIRKSITVLANFYPRSFPTKEELEANIYANYVSVVQRQWAQATHPDLYYLGFGPDNVHGPEGILHYKWHLGLTLPNGAPGEADLYIKFDSDPVLPNRWMHMVGTYEGDSGSMCLYLNGVKIGERTLQGEIRMDGASLERPLVIGCELNADGPAGNIDAYVDEVQIYDRVLSDKEIADLADSARK